MDANTETKRSSLLAKLRYKALHEAVHFHSAVSSEFAHNDSMIILRFGYSSNRNIYYCRMYDIDKQEKFVEIEKKDKFATDKTKTTVA